MRVHVLRLVDPPGDTAQSALYRRAMRHTLITFLMLAACGPLLPDPGDTLVTATTLWPDPDGGTTGDASTGAATEYGQCGFDGPFGPCVDGACAPGLFCRPFESGSVCVAPCGADGCPVTCYDRDLACDDAGACLMWCGDADDCGFGQVCDVEAGGVCVWPYKPKD